MQWLCFLKIKYRLFNIYVQNLFRSVCPQFQEYEAKICQFLVNGVILCIFVTTLSPRNKYCLKNLNKDIHIASLACIFKSVPNFLIFF